MKIVGRQEFMHVAGQQSLSIAKLRREPGVSNEVEQAFLRADRNRDGFIDGSKEQKKLFKNLNKIEKKQFKEKDKGNLDTSLPTTIGTVWGLMLNGGLNAAPAVVPPSGVSGASGVSSMNYDPRVKPLVGEMTVGSPSGTVPDDVQAVKDAMGNVSYDALKEFQEAGGGFVVCQGSVASHLPDIAEDLPRGWPAGSTWKDVNGTFWDETNDVILATDEILGVPGMRYFDPQKNGSISVALHEFAHGYDRLVFRHKPAYRDFVEAYDTDRENGGLTNPYLTQDGLAGREEAFAECLAIHFATDDGLKEAPELQAFFAEHFPK
jgi:hypothetical protein